MRFEEGDQSGEQPRLVRSRTKLVCPDSGQGKEPRPPPFVGQRGRKSGESESIGVVWRL